uniref:Ubiquitin specific peptidase 53 n=1 Tax=Pipistrellus kuhlii TaxID=59472 RepID=A0A7J7UAP7_PIPKU|nr:ubiquitin specific peptidase 53 [Pipistrellus kuhlii]
MPTELLEHGVGEVPAEAGWQPGQGVPAGQHAVAGAHQGAAQRAGPEQLLPQQRRAAQSRQTVLAVSPSFSEPFWALRRLSEDAVKEVERCSCRNALGRPGLPRSCSHAAASLLRASVCRPRWRLLAPLSVSRGPGCRP